MFQNIVIVTSWTYLRIFQANNMNQSLYESDWTEMPVANRKMMLTLMTFGHTELKITIPPLYVVCRPALGEVYT